MKLMKIWSILLGLAALILYGFGAASGIFNHSLGLLLFWGSSVEAAVLLVLSAVCLLLCITCFVCIHAFEGRK